MKTADVRTMRPQSKKYQELPGTGRGRKGAPVKPSERGSSC